MLGELSALGSAVAWAFGTVLVKGPASRFSALYLSAIRTVASACLVLIVVLSTGDIRGIAHIPGWAIGFLLAGSLITVIGDVAFVRAIALDDMSRVFPVTTGLYILGSVGGSIVVAHEPATWSMFGGGLLVIGSVSLIAMARRPQAADAQTRVAQGRARVRALGLSVFAAVLWAVSLLILDEAMTEAEALPAAAIRIPFIAMVLTSLAWTRGDMGRYRRLERKDLVALVGSGVLVGLSAILFTNAIKLSSAGLVSILSSTSPLFVVPVSFWVLKEPMTRPVVVGTVLCMAGIWLTMQ